MLVVDKGLQKLLKNVNLSLRDRTWNYPSRKAIRQYLGKSGYISNPLPLKANTLEALPAVVSPGSRWIRTFLWGNLPHIIHCFRPWRGHIGRGKWYLSS